MTTCSSSGSRPACSSSSAPARAANGVCESTLSTTRVARREGRDGVGDAQRQRVVPGRDHADDADGVVVLPGRGQDGQRAAAAARCAGGARRCGRSSARRSPRRGSPRRRGGAPCPTRAGRRRAARPGGRARGRGSAAGCRGAASKLVCLPARLGGAGAPRPRPRRRRPCSAGRSPARAPVAGSRISIVSRSPAPGDDARGERAAGAASRDSALGDRRSCREPDRVEVQRVRHVARRRAAAGSSSSRSQRSSARSSTCVPISDTRPPPGQSCVPCESALRR